MASDWYRDGLYQHFVNNNIFIDITLTYPFSVSYSSCPSGKHRMAASTSTITDAKSTSQSSYVCLPPSWSEEPKQISAMAPMFWQILSFLRVAQEDSIQSENQRCALPPYSLSAAPEVCNCRSSCMPLTIAPSLSVMGDDQTSTCFSIGNSHIIWWWLLIKSSELTSTLCFLQKVHCNLRPCPNDFSQLSIELCHGRWYYFSGFLEYLKHLNVLLFIVELE